ncbi:efflux RND transporter permease subunit [uncultured Flavonifractor sp.]|uniref:efflux RND transporter permease subunit n=1 Tax=uncultured Flavonifractor sp. TaxID=1193534 RepID=UPI00260BFBBE|nr:MMPL family transporter [uncultured Flavonifractor sp.]
MENDITAYLPADTETRQGLSIMEEELTTYGTARIVVSHTSEALAQSLAYRMEQIEGVTSATVGSGTVGGESETGQAEERSDYIQGSDVLINVTFDGEADQQISLDAMSEIKTLLEPYDAYINSEVGNDTAGNLASEMQVILVIAFTIIVLVLLFTSRSYAELPVLMLTFGSAALLNMGTNFIFGTISFVSNSVTVVLQLALAIDYAIILLHRFTEERERLGEDRAACIAALAYSIPAISSSSLTTISGLAAMMFMQFGLGFDMGLVLIKAICFSMLSVFTLMPGLLMLFSNAIQKTQHRSFVPHIDRWGNLVVKLRYVGVPLFGLLLVAGFLLSQNCPYVYGYSELVTTKQNENQIAEQRVNDTFGTQNIMALLVPKGDYASEKALLHRLEQYDEVDYAMGLSNIEALDGYTLTDKLTPRQFSEMTDMDYEIVELLYTAYAAKDDSLGQAVSGVDTYAVPLMDMFLFLYDQVEQGFVTLDEETQSQLDDLYAALTDGQAQMMGDQYSRMVLNLNLPEEGEETFEFLQTIHQEAERYYPADQIFLVGDSTSDYDLSTSFERDNILISVLSVVFVILVLLFTFQSVGLPILLICVIQGSIWINFSFPTLFDQPIFFMGYLVVTSIQMGANIDYAIVISSRYSEMKELMPPKQAIIKALDLAFPTVLTSGTILTSAAYLIGKLSSEPAIVGIGENLSRGTLISMILVMFILPQILLLGDKIVEKTRFNIKVPEVARTSTGTVYVNGRIRGKINGLVDATIRGVIRGDVSAVLDTGNISEPPEAEASDQKEGDYEKA